MARVGGAKVQNRKKCHRTPNPTKHAHSEKNSSRSEYRNISRFPPGAKNTANGELFLAMGNETTHLAHSHSTQRNKNKHGWGRRPRELTEEEIR